MSASRVLLIAYDYPPIVAAQALRWFYLANELAALGVEVHVLCPAMPALPAYPVPNHPRVIEHRVWAGPFLGLSQWLAIQTGNAGTPGINMPGGEPSLLFRAYRAVRFVLDRLLYPDVRTEWYPFARVQLHRLLRQQTFDAVVSSHEPGVDLLLGAHAKRRFGLPWIVDLADPLVGPGTPRWRRWLDRRLEGYVVRQADRVVLTTDRLRDALIARHAPVDDSKFACIPQGTPTRPVALAAAGMLRPGRLNVVFTGSFYERFRDPGPFAAALRSLASPEISLTIVGDNAAFRQIFDGIPNVRFLGRIGHFDCLALQREADLLLNLGNVQTLQVPGKVYEYLGAGRPILHLRSTQDDPCVDLLLKTGFSLIVDNERSAIVNAFRVLLADWHDGSLAMDQQRARRCAEMHGWPMRARRLHEVIAQATPATSARARYAVVHDFLLVQGGAERLVATLASALEAPLITGFANQAAYPGRGAGESVVTLGAPPPGTLARYLVTAWRFAHLSPDLLKRDAVIYSGVVAPMAVHRQARGRKIYYCHSPPRFLYDLESFYRAKTGWIGRIGLTLLGYWMRPRYERAVRAMDVVIANSENVRQRLRQFLGVDARVIYPPIEIKRFRWITAGDYFLSTARLEDFKRVDIIIQAFRRMPGQRLIVASGGRQEIGIAQTSRGTVRISASHPGCPTKRSRIWSAAAAP